MAYCSSLVRGFGGNGHILDDFGPLGYRKRQGCSFTVSRACVERSRCAVGSVWESGRAGRVTWRRRVSVRPAVSMLVSLDSWTFFKETGYRRCATR